MDQVESTLEKSFTMADLSLLAGCSSATVSRPFRKHLGQSPLSWVLDRRIERAKQLLSATDLPIARIGRQFGFDDPYHFSRIFKQRADSSPRAWRRQNLGP